MDLTGGQLGRYEIIRAIGQGGMATVYLARDTALQRQLAIKVLPPALSHDPTFGKRLEREARAIARLQHPNIVTIYDIGQEGDLFYIAMEFLPGISLSQLIQQDRHLPADDLLTILSQIADALDYAHSEGILHRDVKPSNIVVEEVDQGKYRVKLLDFGLAQLLGDRDTALTGSGVIVGTPAYMSPEQVQGSSQFGPATDIYSLGMVTFEALSGRLPFHSDTPIGLAIHQLRSEVPPITSIRPDLPSAVDHVLFKALAKTPDARYQTASAFVEALAAAFRGRRLPTQLTEDASESSAATVFDPTPTIFPQPVTPPPDATILLPELKPSLLSRFWAAVKASFNSARESFRPEPEPKIFSEEPRLPDMDPIIPSSSPAPVADVPPSLVINPSASLILRPHLYELLDPLKESTIRELLSEQEPERLVDYIVAFGGRRFILTGYGSFGGTTLTREIVKAVEQQMQQNRIADQLLSVRFNLVDEDNQTINFKVTLKDSEPILADEHFTDINSKVGSAPYQVTEILDTLETFLVGKPGKSTLANWVKSVYTSNAVPSRPIVVIDKITNHRSLELFVNHPLFDHKIVTFLVVIPREQYDRWEDRTRRRLLKRGKFEVWPVPSLWESDKSLVKKTVDLCFSSYQLNNRAAKDLHDAFVQHISFVSRGALGAILNELQQLKYWRLDEHTKQPFIDFNALDQELIRHNASVQSLLDANWSRILGQNFPGRERTDRAKQGVYALMDWIIDYATFTLDEVLEAAGQRPIIVSPYPRLCSEVVMRLLDVLVENKYLQRIEDEFDITWGRDVSRNAVSATRVINRSEELTFWEEQLSQYRRNWQKLIKDRAIYAEGEVPLHLQNAIEAEEERIAATETRLAELRGEDSGSKK